MPGVVAILTADELGVAPHHGFATVHPDFARPPLADGRVRFVGEPIAVVLAETFEQGEDAAEMVWADIEPLPTYVDAEAALADGRRADLPGPRVEPGAGHRRQAASTDLSTADMVVRGRYVNQRMAVVPMEPDCCAAEVDATGRLTFWASTQMPHGLHGQLAAALGMEPARDPRDHRHRSAAGSAARPASTPSTPSSPRRPGEPGDRSCGCRRAATT